MGENVGSVEFAKIVDERVGVGDVAVVNGRPGSRGYSVALLGVARVSAHAFASRPWDVPFENGNGKDGP